MTGVLVPLVSRTVFSFDDLQPASVARTTMVRAMPLYAWLSATVVVRVEANSLVPAAHALSVWIARTAPSPDDPGEDFIGAEFIGALIKSSTANNSAIFADLPDPWPPYADLEVRQENAGGGLAAGSVTISIDMLVHGRSFDRIEAGRARQVEATG